MKNINPNRWLAAMAATSVVLAACAAPTPNAPEPTKAPAAPAAPAATTAPAATPVPAPTSAVAIAEKTAWIKGSTDPAKFGLKPGKPYAGTKLQYLSCCNTAGQFVGLIKRSQEFTEMTGIEVQWGTTPFGAFKEKLVTELSSPNTPYDLVMWVDSWGHGLKDRLEPLDGRMAEARIDPKDFPNAYIEASSKDGKIYGIPLRGHAQILFYRKDALEKAGVAVPKTWQDIVKAAPAVREKSGLDPISMYYKANSGQNLFNWLSMVWGNNSDVFDKSWKPIFNNPAGLEATNAYIDILKQGYTAKGSTAWGEADGLLEMVQGRSAMFVGWWWMYTNLTSPSLAKPEVIANLGFVPAPGWAGKSQASYGYIWPTGIPKASKNKEAAWEYLKWMTNAETEKLVAVDKGDAKALNNVVVRLSSMKDADVNKANGGIPAIGSDVLNLARTEPVIPEWNEIESLLEVAISEMATGKDVKTTLDKASVDVEAVMKRAGYYK